MFQQLHMNSTSGIIFDHLWFQVGEARIIYQYQYTQWPDFGVPNKPQSFIKFLQEIKQADMLSDPAAPAIVHCRYTKLSEKLTF